MLPHKKMSLIFYGEIKNRPTVILNRNSISVCTLIITSNHLERNQGPKYLLFTPSELSSKDQNQWRKTKPIFVIRPERNGKKIKYVRSWYLLILV